MCVLPRHHRFSLCGFFRQRLLFPNCCWGIADLYRGTLTDVCCRVHRLKTRDDLSALETHVSDVDDTLRADGALSRRPPPRRTSIAFTNAFLTLHSRVCNTIRYSLHCHCVCLFVSLAAAGVRAAAAAAVRLGRGTDEAQRLWQRIRQVRAHACLPVCMCMIVCVYDYVCVCVCVCGDQRLLTLPIASTLILLVSSFP